MIPEYTTVVGVDKHHLEQLAYTWPTWAKHKPWLLDNPMIVFYDRRQVAEQQIRKVVLHSNLTAVAWPYEPSVEFSGDNSSKWDNAQRNRMLSGFVHVAAKHVRTPYWLKIDTDVVAAGQNGWIDPTWFEEEPAMIAHRWTFTKPPDQMWKLDCWAEENMESLPFLKGTDPLKLYPASLQSERLGHKRIISWCGFFQTSFTRVCAAAATATCPPLNLPCSSQDGFMFYMAKRIGFPIVSTNMKKRGWQHWSAMRNVVEYSRKAMEV